MIDLVPRIDENKFMQQNKKKKMVKIMFMCSLCWAQLNLRSRLKQKKLWIQQ